MKGFFLFDVIVRVPFFSFRDSFTTQELGRLFQEPVANEALFLASPDLHSEFHKWHAGQLDAKRTGKLFESLLKYALRMHTRSTPFGLFSGCGVAPLAGINQVTLNRDTISRSTRFDMNFTCALAQKIAQWDVVQPYLNWYPNSSLYASYDKMRYVEYYYQGGGRIHQVSAVEKSPYLDLIIQSAEQGATVAQLAALITENDITQSEAEGFVQTLIEAQILVSELAPAVIGSELLQHIIAALSRTVAANPENKLTNLVELLIELQGDLSRIDMCIGNSTEVYDRLIEKVKQLDLPFETGKLFQTDLFLTFNEAIKEPLPDTEATLRKALKVLNKLAPASGNENLKAFRERFKQRYEEREMALSEVLDVETGIGYGSTAHHSDVAPFVDDLIFGNVSSPGTELKWNRLQSFLFQKLMNAREENAYSVFLNEDELNQFEENWHQIPESIAVSFNLITKDGKTIVHVNSAGGASAINLLGRFGSSSPEIKKIIDHVADHEHSITHGAVRASIAHLPESRTGNVTLRPVIREYEIPYLSNSFAPFDKRIGLNDLYISVKHNRVVLRSKKLNAEIIPCLDNAHNYANQALPIYHFLCDLQIQNRKPGLYFDWGQLKNEFHFLPRIEIEGAILFPAMWRVQKDKFPIGEDYTESIKCWREKNNVPDRVLLMEGDNELLINFTDPMGLKVFEKILIKRQVFYIKELLFDENSPLVRDQAGKPYASECIGIYCNSVNKRVLVEQPKVLDQGMVPRKFIPGSEWLYYKLYCGSSTSDRILTEIIKPFTDLLLGEASIDQWFFIRYADPEHHIRLRFHITSAFHHPIIIQLEQALRPFIDSGLIWKIQLDTYEREIERYGASTMLSSESIFYADSKACVSILARLEGDEGEQYRWRFAVKMIDDFLTVFDFDLENKKMLMAQWSANFAQEFSATHAKKQLSNKFRIKRGHMELALRKEWYLQEEIEEIWDLLEQRKHELAAIARSIILLDNKGEVSIPKADLTGSYIHMFCNRFFKSKQRLFEFTLLDLLYQYYKSQTARKITPQATYPERISSHENFN